MVLPEIQSLLTQFFYKNECLHFQILIQTEHQTVIYGEYADYTSYKTTYDALQKQLMEQQPIDLASNKANSFAKVA